KRDHVLTKGIVRRQIHAAAEPLAPAFCQEAEIGVDGWHEGIARVQDKRDAGGGEIASFAGNLRGEFLGKLTEDIGEVDAGPLKDAAVLKHARPPAASAFALPEILAKVAAAIRLLQAGADAILEVAKVSRRTLDVSGHMHSLATAAACGLADAAGFRFVCCV